MLQGRKYDWSDKRFLLIDDESFAHSIMKHIFEDTHVQLIEYTDSFKAIDFLLEPDQKIDLVLADLRMPGMDGLEILRKFRQMQPGKNTPFIILSASDDANEKTRLFYYKGTDFILKPFHKGELLARLNMHLDIHELQLELQDKVLELEKLAWVDPLTNLANRRAFKTRLNQEMSLVKRHDRSMGFLMIDVDHFKKFNDTYGHSVGDLVLQSVARRIEEPLRDTDFCARYGGEEFVVILHESSLQGALIVAEKIRRNIEEHSFTIADHASEEIKVTVSIGVASKISSDDTDTNTLIDIADRRLYKAKGQGRNQSCSED